jgi:transposase
LKKQEFPIICIDAHHAKAALSLRVNKTDANDAHGVARIVRIGCYREVVVKTMDSHTIPAMLSARAHLGAQVVTLSNLIRGLVKVFASAVRRAKRATIRIAGAWCNHRSTGSSNIVEPLLEVLTTTRKELAEYERIVRQKGTLKSGRPAPDGRCQGLAQLSHMPLCRQSKIRSDSTNHLLSG